MIRKFNTYNNFTIYCDMDGVLCDFEKKFKELHGSDINDFFKEHGWGKTWDSIEKYDIDFWSTLEWTKDGKQLWDFLSKLDNVEILTGSPKKVVGEYAKKGKHIWVKRELGNVKINHIEGKLKYKYINTPKDILIDDSRRNCRLWEQHGGISILHENADTTIKKIIILLS